MLLEHPFTGFIDDRQIMLLECKSIPVYNLIKHLMGKIGVFPMSISELDRSGMLWRRPFYGYTGPGAERGGPKNISQVRRKRFPGCVIIIFPVKSR
jgi:hypothetical protein